MKYRNMPGVSHPVSEIGFGVWSVATPWWGMNDDQLAIQILRKAQHEYGINFFDTADVYGQGKGETLLQEALGSVRHDIVIATKFGYDIYAKRGDRHGGHTELPQQWSAESIRKACEESLRRLQTDYIDLYQLHNPRIEAIESSEILETLSALQKEGKILSYGVALGPDIGWHDEGIAALENPEFSAMQIINNLLEQDPARSLMSKATEKEKAIVVRVPHASGLLDGSYDPSKHFKKTDHRNHRVSDWMKNGLKAAADLKFLYDDQDRSLAQAAILFSLYNTAVKSVLPNITNLDNLQEFASAAEKSSLTEDEMHRIELLWQSTHKELLTQNFSNSITKPSPTHNPTPAVISD